MTATSDTFPILDEGLLLSLPKANKAQDLERMYTSPNSEDWVTWNMLRALQRTPGDGWWEGVVAAADADAGRSGRWQLMSEPPTVELWRTVPSPPAYESASRGRMALSDDLVWQDRAANARAVEGSTEVDLVFESDSYLVFVEAKLHSDVSPYTTYDPDRNQIARNIDCLIEQAGDREPFFWMLVGSRAPTWRYMQLIDAYRMNPQALHELLPHRDAATLDRIVESIAVITWGDLLPLVSGYDELAVIRAEIERRIGVSPDGVDAEVASPAAFVDLHAVLPGADWADVPSELERNEAIAAAVATLRIEELRHVALGQLVIGLDDLGNRTVDAAHAPPIIRWRLLPMLPSTWQGLAATTIGEMLSIDGVGVGKVRALIAYAASRAVATTSRADRSRSDQPSDESIVAALRSIAAWGAVVGHEDLVRTIIDASNGRSDSPIDSLSLFSTIDLVKFAGPDLLSDADPLRSAVDLLSGFDDRETTILGRRILQPDPTARWTLEQLATEYGITRERVRQIESHLIARIESAITQPRFRPIQRLIRDLRTAIGRACPVEAAPADVQPVDGHLVDELLLWLAGPYDRTDGWLIPRGSSARSLVMQAFEDVSEVGIAERRSVIDALILDGVNEEHTEILIEASELLAEFDDQLFLRPRTVAARAEIQLRLHGRPMSYDELFTLDEDAENAQSFRSAVLAADSLKRVGKDRIALAEWDGEEYPGIVSAMVSAIREAGGSIALEHLRDGLADQFGINKQSVSAYASMSPLFVERDGSIELRTSAEPYGPKTDLSSSKDCFLVDGRWALRVAVNDAVLRGSGRPIPEAFALYLGLQPLSVREIPGPVRDIHAAWHNQPTLGSIRLGVLDLGLDSGDFVFLRYRADGTFEFRRLHRYAIATCTPADRIQLLCGSTGDWRPWKEVLASSLGTESASTAEIRKLLAARGQADLIDLIDALGAFDS